MVRAYYGNRFSKNMTVTPEGFLVCHNVPVGRAGWYEYLGEEIGAKDKTGQIVQVYRSPEEVFSKGAIASFEGKPATDEHPPELVSPENASLYTKGTVQNLRQGSGEDSDLLLADLVIYDEALINEIQDGKREVSCGYDCVYVPNPNGDGTYLQQQISGNHVAVVKSGRAGDRVAIKDSKPNSNPKGAKTMPTKIKLPKKGSKSSVTHVLAAIGLKQFAMDAEPDELQEAVDGIVEERQAEDDNEDPNNNTNPQETGDDSAQDPAVVALEAKVDKLTEMFTQFLQKGTQDDDPDKALDDAISELEGQSTGDDDEEESHTVEAGAMDDEGPVSDPDDRPDNPIPGADNAYKIAALKAIKPALARIPDAKERKKATDAAIAAIKGKPSKNNHSQINKRQKPKALDSKTSAPDQTQLGMDWAKQFNPHYKNKA